MNTFLNKNNYIGLIDAEPDQQQFFNIEKVDLDVINPVLMQFEFAGVRLPALFTLSDLEKTYEREVYTFMEALGDFGGFNDGVLIFPAIIMQIYSSRMYLQSLFSLLPVKQTKISGGRKKMKDKLD